MNRAAWWTPRAAIVVLVGLVAACSAAPTATPSTPVAAPQAAGAAAVTTAISGAAAPTTPPRAETVKVSWVSSLTLAPFFVAVDRGYFREQGIELDLEQVRSAADTIAFLANGQLDLAFGSIAVGLFNAVNQGLDVRVVAPLNYYPAEGGSPMLVRRDLWDSGAVRQLADLRGRNVFLLAPGSGIEYILIKALDKGGLRRADVETVSMPLPDAPLAFANGVVDAGQMPEPWATQMLRNGVVTVLDDNSAPNVLVTTAMAGERLRRERVDVGRRWMVAYLKGMRDLQRREQILAEPTVESMARWTGVSAELVRDLQFLPRWEPNLVLDVDNLLDQQRVHMQTGQITYAEPLPASRLVDTSLVDYAVQQLGRQ